MHEKNNGKWTLSMKCINIMLGNKIKETHSPKSFIRMQIAITYYTHIYKKKIIRSSCFTFIKVNMELCLI